MKNWKRLLATVLALVLVSTMFTGLALAEDKTEYKIPFKKLAIKDNYKKVEVAVADTWENWDFYEMVDYEYDTPKTWDDKKYDYKWDTAVGSSSDNSIIEVGNYGSYKARKAGTATVTIASKFNPSLTTSFAVTVKDNTKLVTGITFNSSSFEVAVDEQLELYRFLSYSPDGAYPESTSYKSSDPEILTNDLVGKKAGSVTVTVTATNKDGSSVEGKVTVTVTEEKALKSLAFSKSSITINKAEKSEVDLYEYLTRTPQNATNVQLKWESSNEKVATVGYGDVYAHRPGTATITVKSKTDPSIKATIEVTVIESEAINEIKFDEKTVVLYYVEKEGKDYDAYNSKYVSLDIQPASAYNTIKNTSWTTSNARVAIPYGGGTDGVTVQAVGNGSCTFTVYIKDTEGKEYSASFKVKVKKGSPTAKLSKKTLNLKVGKKATLKATDADTKVKLEGKWSSSDKSVAKVDKKGKITAKKPGRCVITFNPKKKGMKKVTCVVTVE